MKKMEKTWLSANGSQDCDFYSKPTTMDFKRHFNRQTVTFTHRKMSIEDNDMPPPPTRLISSIQKVPSMSDLLDDNSLGEFKCLPLNSE